MKVSELIAILQGALDQYGDRDALCTWESITPEIASIYIAKPWRNGDPGGEVLIDCDGGSYQKDYAETVIWEASDETG
jgi:hypothetical protein